jgi:hypothetical protein
MLKKEPVLFAMAVRWAGLAVVAWKLDIQADEIVLLVGLVDAGLNWLVRRYVTPYVKPSES